MPVTTDDIAKAANRIAGSVRVTPLMQAAPNVEMKLEFLQVSGTFKARGAFNTLLSQTAPKVGVAAASGGNHGLAVAVAARALGVPATIFVPEISSPAKVAGIRAAGADIRIGGARYNDALAACEKFIAETGALSVHAYDADATIAGQGTVAREWEQEWSKPLDTVLVAVGGGGLIAGMAAWWQRRVKVVGVEPEGSRALYAALKAGKPVDVDVNSVAADSLGARSAGRRVVEIAKAAVDHVVLVPDAAIVDAQKTLWRDYRIATEPGGAAAYAAWATGAYKPANGEHVGILMCGANVDLTALAKTAVA